MDPVHALQEAIGKQLKIKQEGRIIQGKISKVEVEIDLVVINFQWVAVKHGRRWWASKKGHYPATLFRSCLSYVQKKEKGNGCIKFKDERYNICYTIIPKGLRRKELNPFEVPGMSPSRLVY